MPIIEYRCNKCDTVFEIITRRISEEKEVICPNCKSTDASKIPSSGGFVVNGYNYANGYGSGDICYDGSSKGWDD